MNTQPAAFELSISRMIDAPPSRVFRAWTEPALLQQWWGPHGMTTPECEMNLWVGGLFRTLMRAPDGSEYPTQGVFLEIGPDGPELDDHLTFGAKRASRND